MSFGRGLLDFVVSSNIYREVGINVRARRRRLGLTLEELEELSGLSASYIGQVERHVKKASLSTLSMLAVALGIRVGALFDSTTPIAKVHLGMDFGTLLSMHTKRERALLMASLRHLAKGLKGLR